MLAICPKWNYSFFRKREAICYGKKRRQRSRTCKSQWNLMVRIQPKRWYLNTGDDFRQIHDCLCALWPSDPVRDCFEFVGRSQLPFIDETLQKQKSQQQNARKKIEFWFTFWLKVGEQSIVNSERFNSVQCCHQNHVPCIYLYVRVNA